MIISYIYPLLSALFESLKDVSSKMGLKDMDEYIVTWAFGIFALPYLALPFIFISIPPIGNQYWTALLIDGALNVIATILQLKAIKSSDLSLTIPLLAFTPPIPFTSISLNSRTISHTPRGNWSCIYRYRIICPKYSKEKYRILSSF
jgi:uncharacterized membrane protein